MLRRFYVERDEDVHGKSGTGIVAEGVEFDNGWIAYSWLSPKATVTVTNSISIAEMLHSHGGNATNARIVWIDEYNENIEERAQVIKEKKIAELTGKDSEDEENEAEKEQKPKEEPKPKPKPKPRVKKIKTTVDKDSKGK